MTEARGQHNTSEDHQGYTAADERNYQFPGLCTAGQTLGSQGPFKLLGRYLEDAENLLASWLQGVITGLRAFVTRCGQRLVLRRMRASQDGGKGGGRGPLP